MASLEAYGKVDEADQMRLDARRRTRKRITVITLSSVILVVVVVSAVVGTCVSKDDNKGATSNDQPQSLSTSLKAVCDSTLYPSSCYSSLSPFIHNSTRIKPGDLYKLAIQVAWTELSKASSDNLVVLESCAELLDLALAHLNDSLSTAYDTSVDILNSTSSGLDDLMTWLSASGTYLETCIDQVFDNSTDVIKQSVPVLLKNSTELISNSLAIINEYSKVASSFKQIPRRLLSTINDDDEMPLWLSGKDRRLLEKNTTTSRIKADVVVAKDGSGKYKKISDALKAVPDKSDKRFVIYVKKGVYYENVVVEKTKWNVMMIGDGMDATVVSGSLNFVDGTKTFASATFAVLGKGFIARDMGFRNTAGAIKHQAVALMSGSDQSVFYRCRFDAFQDTLYTHSNRQFYRECNIYGTVDFIFGNSAVVFQNCNILPKKPMLGQQNTMTAQGKFDPNQNTGISIQNCTLWPAANLTGVQTFLGRPWKNYSTTVYMNNMMGSLIDPKGWLPWVGTTAPDTIFYAEFANFGPGAVTKNRVPWKGLKFITYKQASKFTVNSFINGNKWIAAAGVNYKPGL